MTTLGNYYSIKYFQMWKRFNYLKGVRQGLACLLSPPSQCLRCLFTNIWPNQIVRNESCRMSCWMDKLLVHFVLMQVNPELYHGTYAFSTSDFHLQIQKKKKRLRKRKTSLRTKKAELYAINIIIYQWIQGNFDTSLV